VLKHAPAPSASLSLAYRDGGLEIEVVNPVGSQPVPGRRADGGHGLVGMRERATMYGGSFTAGPRDGGEFAVRVHLPGEAV
jgi:signal transduction histidine kinase